MNKKILFRLIGLVAVIIIIALVMNSLNEKIESFLKFLHKRWIGGIEQFKADAENFITDPNNRKSKVVRTALYGDIVLEPNELLFIDSFYMQRLKSVTHMGLAHFVYPEARHSRFDHSIGVFWVIKKLWESPEWKKLLKSSEMKETRRDLLYAALLHDIAHGPYSHLCESILEILGIEDILVEDPEVPDKNPKFHELKAREMVLDRGYQLNLINEDICEKNKIHQYYIKYALEKLGRDHERITKMIIGDDRGAPLTPLINGPVDAAKLDYYKRDSFFTGAIGGELDAEFLMRTLKYNEKSEELYFKEKALSTIINMMTNRDYVYSIVAFHPVVRVAQAMLVTCFAAALLSIEDVELQIQLLLNLPIMDDKDLWTTLDIIIGHTGSSKGNYKKLAEDLLRRLHCRKLYKRWCMLSLEECKDYFGMTKVKFNSANKSLVGSDLELKKRNLLIQDELVPLAIASNLDDISDHQRILFEVSPPPKHIDERKKDIRKQWEEIKIEFKGSICSLPQALEDLADDLVKSYAKNQSFLNKAIIMHPEKRYMKNKDKTLQALSKKLKTTLGQPHLHKKFRSSLGKKIKEYLQN